MNPREITIMLGEISNEPEDCENAMGQTSKTDLGQIVERSNGRCYIVDGFHRTWAQAEYCADNDIDVDTYEITVILACEDDNGNDLVATAAEPGDLQSDAIREIYRLAGRCSD